MKNFKWTILLCFLSSVVFLPSLNGAPNKAVQKVEETTIAETSTASTIATKKELRRQNRKAKIQQRLQKFWTKIQKKNWQVDFSDPVNKWLWYAIFAFAGAIALGIINWIVPGSPIDWLAGLLAVAGAVLLIIWLVKLAGL